MLLYNRDLKFDLSTFLAGFNLAGGDCFFDVKGNP